MLGIIQRRFLNIVRESNAALISMLINQKPFQNTYLEFIIHYCIIHRKEDTLRYQNIQHADIHFSKISIPIPLNTYQMPSKPHETPKNSNFHICDDIILATCQQFPLPVVYKRHRTNINGGSIDRSIAAPPVGGLFRSACD